MGGRRLLCYGGLARLHHLRGYNCSFESEAPQIRLGVSVASNPHRVLARVITASSNQDFGINPVTSNLEGRVQIAVLYGESDNKRNFPLRR